jgi:hypothetical protein
MFVVIFEALGQGVPSVVGDAGKVEALGHVGVGQVEPAARRVLAGVHALELLL